MSLQFSETNTDMVCLCEKCGHNRATLVYLDGPMLGVGECNRCSNGIIIKFLRNHKFHGIEQIDTDIWKW